jgi:hypothetical protein
MKRFSYPYTAWMVLLVAVPIVFMIVLSVTQTRGVDFSAATFDLSQWSKLTEMIYLNAFLIHFACRVM